MFFKNNIFKCMMLSVVSGIVFVGAFNLADGGTVTGGSHAHIIPDKTSVFLSVLEKYKNPSKVYISWFRCFDTPGEDDLELQALYGIKNSPGTCWATAGVSTLKYYKVKDSSLGIYNKFLSRAIQFYDPVVIQKGIKPSDYDDYFSVVLKDYRLGRYAENVSGKSQIISSANESYRKDQIGVLLGDDHAMCCGGTFDVRVKYKSGNKTKEATKTFMRVNTGVVKNPHEFAAYDPDAFNLKFRYMKIR